MPNVKLADRVFLIQESKEAPQHVGCLATFRVSQDRHGYLQRLAEGLVSARSYAAPFNYRLCSATLMKIAPAFVELPDEQIDHEFHFRHNALPGAGGERQLGVLVSRLHSRPLDMSRPLWELHLIEGLDVDRFALYFKVHHALFDGIGASRRFMQMLSTDPAAQELRPVWTIGPTRRTATDSPKPARSVLGPLQGIGRTAGDAVGLGRVAVGLGRVAARMVADAVRPGDEAIASPWKLPKTRLNQPVGQQRRLATQVFEFDRVRSVADRAGVTINDVFLAICAGALRRYLDELGELPEESLIAAAPVSLRLAGDSSSNAFTLALMKLFTNVTDPVERIAAINRSSMLAKDSLAGHSKAVAENSAVLFAGPLMAQNLVPGVRGRIRPPYNLLISNVPGPPEPQYLCGARLEAIAPLALLMHGLALFIASYTVGGTMSLGFVGDRDRLPSVQKIAVYTGEALDELEQALADTEPVRSARSRPVPKT